MSSTSFIDQLLQEQSDLTAVERFSKAHDNMEKRGQPALEKHYKELLPIDPLKPGEQFAFEVNLDACTGCKACVVGCHHMNGLDEKETWRKVDLLKGNEASPSVQHLTSACHHCVEPGCLTGCPVQAYEKDETTGVVSHLDDQCIGCRYCELKCPYEVPQYNDKLGIVRKCDMCIGRLKEGEAPACVQSCPNEAIKITTVKQKTIVDMIRENTEMPGNPSSLTTYPTTQFTGGSTKPLFNTESKPQLAHAHMPLAIMLPLTQVGFGLLCASILSNTILSNPLSSLWGFTALMAGLAAAPMHLGSPKNAWKSFLGARTSWLSREMLAFGPFAASAVALSATELAPTLGYASILDPFKPIIDTIIPLAVIFTGIPAIICSAMIYIDTPRPLWKFGNTGLRFGASVGLGLGLGMSVSSPLWVSLIILTVTVALKIRSEQSARLNLKYAKELAPTLSLLNNELAKATRYRHLAFIPWLTLSVFAPNPIILGSSIAFLLTLEVLERKDFFSAGIAPRSIK
jgi:Fe-S-cluster-containing dehydrogenase component/DMSO reductase anchor subunit